jgi:hypothetical protein
MLLPSGFSREMRGRGSKQDRPRYHEHRYPNDRFVLMVPHEDTIELDLNADDSLKMIFSGRNVVPLLDTSKGKQNGRHGEAIARDDKRERRERNDQKTFCTQTNFQ